MYQLMMSFDGLYPPPEILDAVRQGKICAFCLFKHQNVESPAQVRRLTEALSQAAHEGGQLPPIIGIDQEGGQLIAISAGATELPGNMALGATRLVELAEKAGYALGRELLAMGINMNFAPALDINANPQNPVIGIRAFGDHPELVGKLGAALIRGIQSQGVVATAKHFPGHGDTSADSHFAVPVNNHSLDHLQATALLPFRMAIEAGVGAIITAHVIFSAIDDQQTATQSRLVIENLLRGDMGYTGLVITDALDMFAASRFGDADGAARALLAGVDLAMLGHIRDQLWLMKQLATLESPAAVERIRRVQQRLPTTLPALDVVGCAEHRQIAQEIADRSITLVSDNGRLPLRLAPEAELAVITVKPVDLTPADTSSSVSVSLAGAIEQRHGNTQAFELPYNASDGALRDILEATRKAQAVIVGTINAHEDAAQAHLVKALHERGQSPIVVAMRTPYDVTAFPFIETYLCAYSIRAVSCEAAAKALFGEIAPTGILPCSIAGIEQTGIIV